MVHANGGNRLGGSITENDFSLTEDPTVVVKGYWAKASANSANSSSASTSTSNQPTSSAPTTFHKPPLKSISSAKTVAVQGAWADKKKTLTNSTTIDDGPKPPVVQWTSKKEKPVVSGSLFDNDAGQPGEVLTGYWGKKKEEKKIGSIWDED